MEADEEDASGHAGFGSGRAQQAYFGTPLDPLDEDAVPRKKPVPIEEQIATDENGRRRFHGAFTGGFSAGFFNTAGSRDGWAPKHFKSSRSDRKDVHEQRPEDFMDNEDRGEFGIAPQGLKTSTQFRRLESESEALARKRRMESADSTGPIPGQPVLENLLRPAQDTVGVKLLRRMGWRPGQGIGPRITHRQKTAQSHATVRMFGCSLPSDEKKQDSDEESDDPGRVDPRYRDFLFAPDDIPEFLAKPKENLSGIGYKGLDRATVLSSHINLFEPPVKFSDKANKKSMKISGQAFGVGAYEVEDEDIYARDDMSRYDFELAPTDDEETRRKKKSRWNKPVEEVTKCLEGFQLARSVSAVKKIFPAPEIPHDYRPRPVVKKSRFDVQEKRSPPPSARGTNPSVRERHLALSAPGEKPLEQGESSGEQIRKFLASAMPTAGDPSSFKPFARDADKQKRYEQYLVCLKNKRHDALALLQPKTMTEWEREREKVEFERAAMLYRPMTGSMNSKFVSAGSSEDADGGNESGPGLPPVDAQVADAKRAAQMKMYGKLTREKVEWHPAKLLCTRFNVKPPYGDESLVGVVKSARSKFELFGSLSNMGRAEEKQSGVDDHKVEETEEVEPEKRTEEREAEDEEEPFQKAPMDLFKSIFLDSSSSEGEDEQKTTRSPVREKPQSSSKNSLFGTELDSASKKPLPWQEKKENVLRNPAPAQGIFANIDFDALNKKKAKTDAKAETPPPAAAKPNERLRAADFFDREESSDSDEAFGPRKPPQLTGKDSLKTAEDDSSEDSEEWEEKKPSRSKERPNKRAKAKKQKKEKKKKKSKKKKKESKKHKRSREESESSSSSS